MAVSAVVTKSSLRKQMKTRLANMTRLERQVQSTVVTDRVLNSRVYINAKRVCVYLNLEEEVSTWSILKDIFETQKKCFIPRYTSEKMEMLQLHSMEDYFHLPSTKWNIKQPETSVGRDEALESGGLDLMLIPGLAFTSHGHRLGRGKGYYDRYLELCKEKNSRSFVMIGLAFREQIVDYIPCTTQDVCVDEVYFPHYPATIFRNADIDKN